ncbi:MAG: stage II sporulation protein D [Clostridia bacterium]|nr:stage II sporulation protein D [Clostridia bacterium]
MKKISAYIFAVLFAAVILPSFVVMISPDKTGEEDASPGGGETFISVLMPNGEIQEFELESYLFGVLAGEMPASFHSEALKAQAVAARTYIINKHESGDNDHPGADVCTDSTHCKAYLTDDDIKDTLGKNWEDEYGGKIRDAIKATEGEIAVYDGKAIEAVFHSCGSGVTENAEDVWGGDVPYLKSTQSPGDKLSPKYYSEVTVSEDEFKRIISDAAGQNLEPYAGEAARNNSGSVKEIDLGGTSFKGTEVRKMFSLPSANFEIEKNDAGFVFKCKGSGHGVGMSQYGAEYFAENGMGYKDILKTYYKGVEIVKYEGNKDN